MDTANPPKAIPKRTRPSVHLLLLVLIFAISLVGHLAVIWSAELRGYEPSTLVAARDLALFIAVGAAFVWLTKSLRYRGELMTMTAAVLLFAIGMIMQFRLFSDPEYGSRGSERTKAREAKAQTIRLLNIQTGYDDEKKRFLFGSTAVPQRTGNTIQQSDHYSFLQVATSAQTIIPIVALGGMLASFLVFRRDSVLLWLQRHALLIGLATLVPFELMVMFSREGKFFGQTTPWEGVKVIFLVSFAGILADTYRHLRRTRWGLPPLRYVVPFVAVAAMPVLPFFALSDFGQMLVFFGVYVVLYFVAVRKKAQLAYAVALLGAVFLIFFGAVKISSGFGVPSRVYFRFYQWAHTWEPPPPETWWWKRDYERYLSAKNLSPDPSDAQEIAQRNREAWADKVLQQSQGLFGIHEGGVLGTGLGLGFPETVPVSDSDFIYAGLSEETGLLGGLIVLLTLGVFVFAGTSISLACDDMFTKLVAAGLTAFVGLQALVNIGGVIRLLPMTGITLPFVSHGGWSLITSFVLLGVLLAISHRNVSVQAARATRKNFSVV
jgi:cell division protein FtsW (lipid II flippase)